MMPRLARVSGSSRPGWAEQAADGAETGRRSNETYRILTRRHRKAFSTRQELGYEFADQEQFWILRGYSLTGEHVAIRERLVESRGIPLLVPVRAVSQDAAVRCCDMRHRRPRSGR